MMMIRIIALFLLFSIPGFASCSLDKVSEHIQLFQQKHSTYKQTDETAFAKLVMEGQADLAKKLGASGKYGKLDPEILIDLKRAFSHASSIILMMRHGEQKISAQVAALPNEALKKIAMMRETENKFNSITDESYVELFAVSLALDYLREANPHLSWEVISSGNHRALHAAELMAQAMHLAGINKNSCWDCINYPDEEAMSSEELLALLPTGALPWEKGVVDAIVGQGAYELIRQNVALETMPALGRGSLIVTHTQQQNAFAEQNGLPIKRLGNYGFIFYMENSGEPVCKIYESGLFQVK